MSEFVVPVDTIGLSNTGLALFNPAAVDASVELILRELGGQESARTTITMNKGTHLARFVSGPGQLFPSVAEFRGTLGVRSSIPIAALGLKQNGAPPAYTSLPAVSNSSAELQLNFPHVANGSFDNGSFRSSFLVFNMSSAEANVDLAFTKDDGSPFIVTIPGSGTNSAFAFKLDPRAGVYVQTDGSGPLSTGTDGAHISLDEASRKTVMLSQGRDMVSQVGMAYAIWTNRYPDK